MSKETAEQTTRLQSSPKVASALAHTLLLQAHLLTILEIAQIHSFTAGTLQSESEMERNPEVPS